MTEEENKNQLPKEWMWVKLGELFHTTSGGTPSRREARYYDGDIPWVKSGELDKGIITETEEKISREAVNNSSTKIFPKGTLLIALYGATIGKLAFLGVDAATNQAICGIYESAYINSKFLYHYLFFKKQNLVNQGIGGAQPNISQTILKDLDLPLPPKAIQDAVVSKIEELLSELDKGMETLAIVQQQLKIQRHSILKQAFEGKLTNEIVIEGELPENWKIIKLKDMSESIQYGYTESSTKEPIGPKFLRITDIQENKVNWNDVPYCKIAKEKIEKYSLKEGDLVFARTGATVGKSFLLKGEIPEAVFASYLIRVRVTNEINEKYLSYFFLSPNYWSQITEGQVGIGQPNVNGTKLGQLDIVVAPKKEQYDIVQALESRLSVTEKMEETIAVCLQHAEVLRHSILKKAFRGNLIGPITTDESVEILLDKIKVEKALIIEEERQRSKIDNEVLNKTKKMGDELKTLLELLSESKGPITSKKLWESSIHKDDIDAFYAELKKHIDNGEVKELPRKGKESSLQLIELK